MVKETEISHSISGERKILLFGMTMTLLTFLITQNVYLTGIVSIAVVGSFIISILAGCGIK